MGVVAAISVVVGIATMTVPAMIVVGVTAIGFCTAGLALVLQGI